MGKELTNRQLAEAVGYALEKAEKNIRESVFKLESERKSIETFKVDTDQAERVFREADANFKKSLGIASFELRKLQETKPKWLQLKDWLLIGSLSLLVVISLGLAVSFYYKLNQVEEENIKLNNAVNNVSTFFEENPKEKESFQRWNK